MTHHRVREVMTADVACARQDTPFKELAGLMAARGISALPVLDDQGRVTGVVSEVDLLRKEEYQEDGKRPPRWRHPHSRAKAAGVTAKDVMTSPALTIGPDATVVEAARALLGHHVKRMPVVDSADHLAGIVSQRDLLRVFLRSDQEIRNEILTEVFGEELGTNLALVQVDVAEGVVTLSGEVRDKSMIGVAVRLAHSVDGVVDVVNHLTYAVDDTPLPKSSSLSDVKNARFIPPQPDGDTENLRRMV
ncbi:MAG TPA: inosine-5'-monophosphate dehydrogenase [Actinobacteria bacterium]|nr:inosine-5'-monophosphate dehydrogenase [Actinomycetota bacterium]